MGTERKTVLTIAGSDCSGGAGVQADIKTITAHRMYASSVITALTAQNTTGVYGIAETAPEFVGKQLDCVFQDIRPDAVKIGMTGSAEIIRVIGEKLRRYDAKNIVIDPVMVSTSGRRLLDADAAEALVRELFPLGTVITPNIPEAEALCGVCVKDRASMELAAGALRSIAGASCGVLVKGGHLRDAADDLLLWQGSCTWFSAPRIESQNTHGTGCTLSSAIACGLAEGKSLEESVRSAKEYITGAIASGLDLGRGNGPLDHLWLQKL